MQYKKPSRANKFTAEALKDRIAEAIALVEDFEKMKSAEEWEMGIDEAGRGPVLGPMVYGCCYWPVRLKEQLARLGFADSKQLTEEERDSLFEVIRQLSGRVIGYEVREISAEEMSNRMLAQNETYLNLNQISFNSAYFLINQTMAKGFNVTRVYVDTVGSASAYEARLTADFALLYPNLGFTVSEKADSKFPVVSAASIAAKVTRDLLVRDFRFTPSLELTVSKNFGSGYPADPNTKAWLKQNYDPVFAYPEIVRYSWSTITNLLEENKLRINFHSNDEKGQTRLDFTQKQKRPYFAEKLQISTDVRL